MIANRRGVKVHISWQISWFAVGIVIGIALASVAALTDFTGSATLVLALLLFVFAILRRTYAVLILALVGGVLFGMWRGGSEKQAISMYESYISRTVVVQGRIAEDPTIGHKGELRLTLESISIQDTKMPGKVRVSITTTSILKRGDELAVSGQLSRGFGTVSAVLRNAEIIVHIEPMPGDIGRRVRDWFTRGIRRAIPEPEVNLSIGYLVGQKTALPEVLAEQLKIVGLTHAVVASGYNLTILVGFMRRTFMRYSKYLSTVLALMLVICFMLITGFSPSMSRAGLVAALSLAAWYYGRVIHPVVLLSVAGAATAVWRPAYVWGDIGWYLSFTAFIGVIIMSPLLTHYFFGPSKHGLLRQTFIDTMSAQIMTMPIILYTFGQYATYALLANILVLPLIPFIMLASFVAGIAGIVLPSFSWLFGWPAKAMLACNIAVIGWISQLPGASGEIDFSVGHLVLSYVVLVMAIVYMWRATGYNPRQSIDTVK